MIWGDAVRLHVSSLGPSRADEFHASKVVVVGGGGEVLIWGAASAFMVLGIALVWGSKANSTSASGDGFLGFVTTRSSLSACLC